MRDPVSRGHQLADGEVRHPRHRDAAVTPRAGREPRDGRPQIVHLGRPEHLRRQRAPGAPRPAGVDHRDRVSAPGQVGDVARLVERCGDPGGHEVLVVRTPAQQGRLRLVGDRTVQVPHQDRAVGQGDLHVGLGADPIARPHRRVRCPARELGAVESRSGRTHDGTIERFRSATKRNRSIPRPQWTVCGLSPGRAACGGPGRVTRAAVVDQVPGARFLIRSGCPSFGGGREVLAGSAEAGSGPRGRGGTVFRRPG